MMAPEKIKSKIILLKKKQTEIAKKADVTPAMISMVISGRGESKKVKKVIAMEIDEKFEEVWGAA